MNYRIGIDVGGTFTHAVAIDAATLQIVSQAKVATTHRAAEGVALGVTQSLNSLLSAGITSDQVSFIAHSTTQATNALLEGDVSPVGIIGMAHGTDALKARKDTEIGRLEVAAGRFLSTSHTFIDSHALSKDIIREKVLELQRQGAEVIVAAEAFGVDDSGHEQMVLDTCADMGIPATASHEVSGLYGLRTRTRTAVINAAILPRMMQTAEKTALAVRNAGINAPLMIMRSDGGVMTIEEVRRRPILTILSGPAAGVAAALMYARISDGIFIEVGGTSSDITCIRNGQASVQSATIGGHKLFLRTLDVRTIGLAGGSMIRLQAGKIVHVGPRSAHLAGLAYSCFSPPMPGASLQLIQPLANDPVDYAIAADGDAKAALTMTCCANAAGMVPAGDYAFGDGSTASRLLSEALHLPPTEAAMAVQRHGCTQAVQVVEQLIADYELRRELLTLIGGGGGAGAVVPCTGAMMQLPWRIAENAPVIAAIGVALALVRDSVERTIPNPSKEDLLRIRREAIEAVVRVGANPDTVEVQIEIDSQRQIVRATASGATEMRTREIADSHIDEAGFLATAARSLAVSPVEVIKLGSTKHYTVYSCDQVLKKLFGLIKSRRHPLRLLNNEGVIRLQLLHGEALVVSAADATLTLQRMISAQAHYDDGGERLPAVFLIAGARIFNLSGLLSSEQMISLAEVELQQLPADDEVMLVVGIN